jgi:hypothetical protein
MAHFLNEIGLNIKKAFKQTLFGENANIGIFAK